MGLRFPLTFRFRWFVAEIKFEPRDLWVGVFWDWRETKEWGWPNEFHIYACALPTLVLHVVVPKEKKGYERSV